MRALSLRICRMHVASTLQRCPCVWCNGGEPAPGLPYYIVVRWRTHANEGGAHDRADETGLGRGCATALSSALGARMYLASRSSVCAGWGAREHLHTAERYLATTVAAVTVRSAPTPQHPAWRPCYYTSVGPTHHMLSSFVSSCKLSQVPVQAEGPD
jgi:hypothetical protein